MTNAEILYFKLIIQLFWKKLNKIWTYASRSVDLLIGEASPTILYPCWYAIWLDEKYCLDSVAVGIPSSRDTSLARGQEYHL